LGQLVTAHVLPGWRGFIVVFVRAGLLVGLAVIVLIARALLLIVFLWLRPFVLITAGASYLGRSLGDHRFVYLGDLRLAILREDQREGYRDQDKYQERRRAQVYEVAAHEDRA
jgi:hypothetical protein